MGTNSSPLIIVGLGPAQAELSLRKFVGTALDALEFQGEWRASLGPLSAANLQASMGTVVEAGNPGVPCDAVEQNSELRTKWHRATEQAVWYVAASIVQAAWRGRRDRIALLERLSGHYVCCLIHQVLRQTDTLGNQIFGMDPQQLQGFIETRIQHAQQGRRLEPTSVSNVPPELLEVSEEFSCPVCHMLMFKPIVTPCQHKFCKFCLLLWVDTVARSAVFDDRVDSCPMCRAEIDISQLEPDKELEREIIAEYGTRLYHSRHCDMMAEKVERLIAHSSEEQREVIDEIQSAQVMAFLYGARAGMVGTAFAGPVGLVVGFGIGFVSPYIRKAQIQELGKFGIVEDDTGLDDDRIKVVNTTLTPVKAYLFRCNGSFSLDKIHLEPSAQGSFDLSNLAAPSPSVFTLQVFRPDTWVDKELASTTVWRGRTYLFCCTDAVVRPTPAAAAPPETGSVSASSGEVSSPLGFGRRGTFDGRRGTLSTLSPARPSLHPGHIHIKCEGSSPVQLEVYSRGDRFGWYCHLQITLVPGQQEAISPSPEADSVFRVIVYSGEPNKIELATVEMERGKDYTIGDSRFHTRMQQMQDDVTFLEALLD